jgi:hypothetical protein
MFRFLSKRGLKMLATGTCATRGLRDFLSDYPFDLPRLLIDIQPS